MVEIGNLDDVRVDWCRAEKVVIAEVLVSGAQKLMVLTVHDKANFNLGCELMNKASVSETGHIFIVCSSLHPCMLFEWLV